MWKLWLNVIFVWIAVVLHSSLFFFLILTSFIDMKFLKFSSFFQVVWLSAFGDDKFLQKNKENVILCG